MAKFRYTATDRRGKWVSGETDGPDREAVEVELSSRGMTLESVVEAESVENGSLGRISNQDAVELVQQLVGLARAGLPLPSGLRASGAEVESPAVRSVFIDLANSIESGADLGTAIGSQKDRFPGHLRGLLLAGARSGRLAEVLADYVRVANLGTDLRRRFWGVVAYPMVTGGLVMVLVIFVCSISVRTAESLMAGLSDFNVTLPAQTQVVLLLARTIADHWHELLIGLAVLVGGSWLFLRTSITPARRRRLACGVPVLGPTLRFISLTEFCQLLAMLLEAETPMPEALELAGQGTRDADVAESCDRMALAVSRGQSLSTAIRLWSSMPAGLGQLFQWSEGHRSLPESLRLAGEMFEARARSQVGFAANFVNTLLVLLILWWVGFALATLYLPLTSMIQMISKLSG